LKYFPPKNYTIIIVLLLDSYIMSCDAATKILYHNIIIVILSLFKLIKGVNLNYIIPL
jgi:hypothetical protein